MNKVSRLLMCICTLAMLVAFVLAAPSRGLAQGQATAPATAVLAPALDWVEQGPAPELANGAPWSGAINAIAIDPSDPSGNTVYVGAVNGGIWKTTNATAAAPTWTPLTDLKLPGLSIRSLAISPKDSMLFAGTGSSSSAGFDGFGDFGVARSLDAGQTWQVLAASTFAGQRNINSIVPTSLSGGKVVLAATDGGGVFRSQDRGVTFTRISGSAGLPNQGVSSLVADPGDPMRFYAAVPGSGTGFEGIYKSTNGGLIWAPVNTGLTGLNTTIRILLSVHYHKINKTSSTSAVYAMTINNSGGEFAGRVPLGQPGRDVDRDERPKSFAGGPGPRPRRHRR